MADIRDATVIEGAPANEARAPDPVMQPCIELGCLSERDVARARAAGMLSDPEARALLDDYIHGTAGAAVPCVCARLRGDLMLAQARTDEAHATRLARALLLYLTEHRPHCGG